ncbi:MAG: hypothetical protein ACREMQ_03195 [Longimicrobiales bacterium]
MRQDDGKNSEDRGGGSHAAFQGPEVQPAVRCPSPARQGRSQQKFRTAQEEPEASLHFKQIKDDLWSVRVGRGYRALAIEARDGFHWFWIGSHADYDRLID